MSGGVPFYEITEEVIKNIYRKKRGDVRAMLGASNIYDDY